MKILRKKGTQEKSHDETQLRNNTVRTILSLSFILNIDHLRMEINNRQTILTVDDLVEPIKVNYDHLHYILLKSDLHKQMFKQS